MKDTNATQEKKDDENGEKNGDNLHTITPSKT